MGPWIVGRLDMQHLGRWCSQLIETSPRQRFPSSSTDCRRMEPFDQAGSPQHHANARNAGATDGQLRCAGQGLAPVVNSPNSLSPLNIMYWPAVYDRSWQEAPSPLAPGVLMDVDWSDFEDYLLRLSGLHIAFNHSREQLEHDTVRRIIARDPEGERVPKRRIWIESGPVIGRAV